MVIESDSYRLRSSANLKPGNLDHLFIWHTLTS